MDLCQYWTSHYVKISRLNLLSNSKSSSVIWFLISIDMFWFWMKPFDVREDLTVLRAFHFPWLCFLCLFQDKTFSLFDLKSCRKVIFTRWLFHVHISIHFDLFITELLSSFIINLAWLSLTLLIFKGPWWSKILLKTYEHK